MIITADKAMVPQLKELWLCCFQDAAEDVDYFFDRRFESAEGLADMQDGAPAGMLFLLRAGTAQYVYALAVHPAFRGGGIAGGLLAEAQRRGRQSGLSTFLVPAEEGLFRFYKNKGFYTRYYAWKTEGQFCRTEVPERKHREEGRTKKETGERSREEKTGEACAAKAAEIRSGCTEFQLKDCGPQEYYRMRACWPGCGDIAWDEAAVCYAVEENAHAGGGCRKILLPGGQQGAVLYRCVGRCLLMRELLLPARCGELLPALAEELAGEAAAGVKLPGQAAGKPSSQAVVSPVLWRAFSPVPYSGSELVKIGMSDQPGQPGYLNLVLD